MQTYRRVAAFAERGPRQMGVQQALEWAFGRECARLDLDVIDPENNRGGAAGTEWILMQRQILGCKVDGGSGIGWGGSAPHHDAEVVAAVVAARFDRRTASQIAELARAGITPDWMPNARPACVPREWRKTKHGTFAETVEVGEVEVIHRGRKVTHKLMACPVMFVPTAAQIERARRAYLDWWGRLLYLASDLQHCEMLTTIEVVDVMPPMTPWRVPPISGLTAENVTL